MLKASNIYKSFGDKDVLKGVDLAVKPGEITCLIGPSGTGKTTLLRALGLLDYPDKGSITVNDKTYTFPLSPPYPPASGGEDAVHQGGSITPPWPKVTVVFQSLFLWPHMTLRENIMLPARNVNPNAEKDIEGLCKVFEMEHFIDNYPNEASIGQRQRVALARALILNPDYILMDEITAALDIEQTARILTKLEHLKERGIGVFIITHQIGFARRAGDNIVFMDAGHVVEQGGPEILKAPKTERLKDFLSMVELAS